MVALFTGQGSQFPGMGKAFYGCSPAARAVLDEADHVLPGLLALCFEGPAEQLVLTENTQPCVLAVDLAAFAGWREAGGPMPTAAAGHSLGEYAALVVAGALDLATALALVKARGKAMQEAVPPGVGGMVALLRMTLDEAKRAQAMVTRGICDLANWNAPGQYVMSGETAAMQELAERFGRRQAARLDVSVPFHSSMLRQAGERFATQLARAPLQEPAFPIVCNVDAEPVTTSAAVRDALVRQFAGSVLWQPSIERMIDEGHRVFVELGPKPVLRRMVEQIAQARGVEVTALAVCEPKDLALAIA